MIFIFAVSSDSHFCLQWNLFSGTGAFTNAKNLKLIFCQKIIYIVNGLIYNDQQISQDHLLREHEVTMTIIQLFRMQLPVQLICIISRVVLKN